jgi:hypothetical protein
MPSCLQRGPSVAIPSVQTPKLSNQRLHPHFIVQVGPMLSEALQLGTTGNVLRPHKFTKHFPGDDERHIQGSD